MGQTKDKLAVQHAESNVFRLGIGSGNIQSLQGSRPQPASSHAAPY